MNNEECFGSFSENVKKEVQKLYDITRRIEDSNCNHCNNSGAGGEKQLSYMDNINMTTEEEIDDIE